MIRPEFRKKLERWQIAVLFVWILFLIWAAIYLFVPYLNPDHGEAIADFPLETFRQVLWVIVAIQVAFLFWWRKHFLSKEFLLRRGRETRLMPTLLRGHQTPTEKVAARVLSWYILGSVVAFAVADSIAIYGLYLGYIGEYFLDQYILSFICLLLLIYFYPTKAFFTELLGELDSVA